MQLVAVMCLHSEFSYLGKSWFVLQMSLQSGRPINYFAFYNLNSIHSVLMQSDFHTHNAI